METVSLLNIYLARASLLIVTNYLCFMHIVIKNTNHNTYLLKSVGLT